MAVWNVDLTTEDGALSAAQMGSYACFVTAVLTLLGLLVLAGATPDRMAAIAGGVAVGVEALVFVIAGLRLRAGKGMVWGIVAAVLLALEILYKIGSLMLGIGIVINILLLIVLINGIRGARALKAGGFDTADAEEIFR